MKPFSETIFSPLSKIASATVLALVIAGCGGSTESSDSGASGAETEVNTTLRINLSTKPATIDPLMADGIPEHKLMLGLFDPLVRLDENCQPIPAAAESWTNNEDYTEWTFKLRENGKWHNGDPVTSADFKYSLERFFTPSTNSKYVGVVLPHIAGAEEFFSGGGLDSGLSLDSIKTPDDLTITYTMNASAPYFITFVQLFTFMPVHRATVEANPADWAMHPETFVGNGPFTMKEHRQGDRIIAVPSEYYWDRDRLFWEEIHYFMIDNQTTENTAFRNGEMDITNSVLIPEINYWSEKPEYSNKEILGTYYISMNNQVPPFDDARVRRAFSLVVDRSLITERVTQRHEPVSRGFIPAALPSAQQGKFYGDVSETLIPERNIEEAKRLLAEAGYGPDNPLPEIEYIYNTSDDHKQIAEQLQRMWKTALNADVRIQNMEWGSYLARMNTKNFTMARSSWVGDYLDPMTFLEIFRTGGSKNAIQYSNPEYDALLDKAMSEGDPIKREGYLVAAEKMLIGESAAIAPLFTQTTPILTDTTIKDFDRNIMGNFNYIYARR